MDVVKSKITEKNGVNLEYEEEIKTTDYLSAGGMAFLGDVNFLVERVGDVIKCRVPDYSMRPNIVNDELTFLEYFAGPVQTTPNRICRGDFTYVDDNLTSEVWRIYDRSDGTTVLRTITYTHTYDANDLLTNSQASEV